MIFIIVYRLDNKSNITNKIGIIDIQEDLKYEIDHYKRANKLIFESLNEAISYARKLSEKYNLIYTPFVSRYDSSTNEDSGLYL